MSLDAIGALVPDRADVELIFLDAKGGFGLGELDVGLPQLSIAPITDVGAQQVGALGKSGPVVERGETRMGGAPRGIPYQRDRVGDCGPVTSRSTKHDTRRTE